MNGKDGMEMLNLVEQQDGIRTALVLKTVWSTENEDQYTWRINGCLTCDREMHEGAEGFVWGKPLNNEPGCKYVSLLPICSDECVERAMEAWAAELGCDVMTGYFGE